MKVTLLQTDIRWSDADYNIRQAERLVESQAGSDLYVLPEMWSTGFATQPAGIAHPDGHANAALAWMTDAARRYRCAVSGSVAVGLPDGSFRNRHYFVDGHSGTVSHYDKHHLFTYGGENRCYTPGSSHTIVSYQGWRLLLLTCYDLRFPVWSRYATGREYDAIVLVANWPASRQSAWQLLTRARAIENQCYVIAVNRVGDDHLCHYAGASVVADPMGRTAGQCRKEAEQALTVLLDPEELRRRREKFRVLDDRDPLPLYSGS